MSWRTRTLGTLGIVCALLILTGLVSVSVGDTVHAVAETELIDATGGGIPMIDSACEDGPIDCWPENGNFYYLWCFFGEAYGFDCIGCSSCADCYNNFSTACTLRS